MKWVVESIKKVLEEEQRRGTGGTNSPQDNDALMNTLLKIQGATSKIEANAIEEELMLLSIQDKFSYSIQERVVKVVSMAGYVKLSLHLLDSMLGISSNSLSSTMSSQIYIPSYMAYTSVLNRLRKWKKIDTMRETLQKLSHACKIMNQNLDIVALNTYLAAICDTMKMRNEGEKDIELMREAMDLLYPGVAMDKYTLPDPDVVSFNTVLNAAAEMKNGTLVKEAIHLMKKQGIAPDIVTYNAMLKAAPNAESKVAVVDEILEAPDLVADRYTVEMALMPLVEEGRIPDLLNLLHGFSSTDQPEHAVQNAYSTFLLALVKGRELDIARAIFDVCILSPSLAQSDSTQDFIDDAREQGVSIKFISVKPLARHFNALFEGYRTLDDPHKYSKESKSTTNPQEHTRLLLDHMKAMNVPPDSYTVTLLMGLQQNSKDITKLWNSIMELTELKMEPPIYHSIITAYGKVGDAASACIVFDKMIAFNNLSRIRSSWNVLLSALSKASITNPNLNIDCMSSAAASLNFDVDIDVDALNQDMFHGKNFVDLVYGMTAPQASREIITIMATVYAEGGNEVSELVWRPNAQAYCLVASAMSQTDEMDPDEAIRLFNAAIDNGVSLDGRFLNAIIRCYGDNIMLALDSWKTVFRPYALSASGEDISRISGDLRKSRMGKNLVASYHGLMYVAGRAYRPDIALRLAYAMVREGVEPTEAALNTYNSGARERQEDSQKVRLHGQYENLLLVECTKYDSNDRRRLTDKRVRIIL